MHELLAEGDFVRALARQLIAGADADDVAQEAWLAVLRQRPAGLREPRSWLARLVQRLAANRARSERRRTRREREVGERIAREAPSTDSILACEQVRQRVVAAVLALDEPFRGTVLARFYECLDSAAIAARDGVEVATVRSRLKRGIERLRAKLDSEHAGQRGAWAAPLALLGRGPAPTSLPLGAAMTTSKKALAAIAAAMLFGLTLWAGGLLSPTDARAPATARPAEADVVAVVPSGEAREAERRAASSAPSATRFGEPRERVPYPLADEPIDDVPVRALDAATRTPVAGADVWFLPFRVDFAHPSTRGDQRLHELANSEAFFEKFGTRVRTDAAGETTVRVPRSGDSVLVARGDLRARVSVDPERLLPGERVVLWLERVREVRLRCVDESGAPVEGALVDARWAAREAVVARPDGGSGLFGPSDADGFVVFRLTATAQKPAVRPCTITAGKWQALELPGAFERTTDVRIPATGSMTIELRTPSGALWPAPIEGSVSCSNPDLSSSPIGPYTWCHAERGVYRVPRLALGLTWKVSACEDAMSGVYHSTVAAGPRKPGEDVRVVITTPSEPCIAWANLRMPDGAMPCTSWSWAVFQGDPDREWLRALGKCEPDGRVGFPVNTSIAPAGRIELSNGSGPVLGCAWRLDSASSGSHDLGTLVLAEPPLLAAGRIDVAGAGRMPPLRVAVESEAGDTWRPLRTVSVDTSAERTFALRGLVRTARVRVSVLPDAHCLPSEPCVVAVGTRDLRFRVDRGHALQTRLLAPAEFAQAMHVRAQRLDGAPVTPVAAEAGWDEPRPRTDGALVDFDGTASTYAWPALPAGAYRIEVHAPGVSMPLATIDGVQVGEGAAQDPRLDPIDLRERVRTLVVSLVPLPAGPRPVTDGGVLAFPTGAPGDTVHGLLFDERGEARLVVGTEPVDVIVAVPGFRLWRAQSVTQTTLQVQLEPAFSLPFRLAPRVAEAFAGHAVMVSVKPKYRNEENPAVVFLRAGERSPAMQSSLSHLTLLAGGGRCTLDDSRAVGTFAVADFGTFEIELQVRGASGWLPVGESWLNWQRSPLLPPIFDFQTADQPPVVLDIDDTVLPKVVDEMSRNR